MSGRIKSTDMKVNCLIQATLGCLPIQEFALNQDSQKIFRAASRLVRCLMELQLLGDSFSLQLSATLMHKCIQARLWETSKHVAKQLEKIGVTLSTTLVNAGLTTFEKLQETNPRELELIMNRHPPFGNQIRDAVAKLPRYAISLEQSSSLSVQQAELTVSVQLVNHAVLKEAGSTAGPSHTCILFIGDADNHVLIKQKIFDSQMLASGRFSRRLTVKRASSSPELRLHLISLEYVGIDVQEVYSPRYSGPPALKAPQATKAGARKGSYKPCAHRCINKVVCGHACCRNGLVETANDEFQSHYQAPPTTRPRLTPTPTRMLAAEKKAPPPRKRAQGAMGNFLSELHSRTSCIPETPALKRLKPSLSSSYPISSSRGGEYSPSLSERFSYAPSAKKMSPPTRSRPMRSKLSDSRSTHSSSFNTSYTANSSASSFSSGPSEEVTTSYPSSVSPPPTASYDDYGDFDFPDDHVFEFQSDPDSDTALPAFTMDTSYSTATKSSTGQYQNSTSRFSLPKNPSLKTNTPKWMNISSRGQEIDRTQKPGSMPPPAATGLMRPLDDSFSETLGPLPTYQTYHSTVSSQPTSSTPKKPGCRPFRGVPLPRSSFSTPAGSQQVPLSKKLSLQMQHINSSVFANQTRPPMARPKPGDITSTIAKPCDDKAPPFTFIPKPVKTTGSHPVRTVTATPTRQPPPSALASVAAFNRSPSPGTGGACSFFTTGPVSGDDGDLFDSVFAGIF